MSMSNVYDDCNVAIHDYYADNDSQFPLTQLGVTEDYNLNPAALIGVDTTYFSDQFLKDLSLDHIYSTNFESIYRVDDDNFFQLHAIRCGYNLTGDSLSVMNKQKIYFLGEVDSVLNVLNNDFYFLKESGRNYENRLELISNICSSFSKSARDLIPVCTNILQSKVVPTIIKSIFDSVVVDNHCVREMTYPEMEQLFVHFVSTLEKLVIQRVMRCWDNFCYENKGFLSSISVVDYSNPFALEFDYNGVAVFGVTHPAAFMYNFGECISLMAGTKIGNIVSDFIVKCSDTLKNMCSYKCSDICKYSSDSYADIREFRNKLDKLIKGVFDREIIDSSLKYNLSDFLSKLIIWNNQNMGIEVIEKVRLSTVESIVDYAYNSLSSFIREDLYDIVSVYYLKILEGSKYTPKWVVDLGSIEHRWGIKLHPRDSHGISSIRRKYSSKSKVIIRNKMLKMLKEKYEFSDGTTISMSKWSDIVKKLFPIIREAVNNLIDDERLEISKILSNVRIIENTEIFDDHYSGTREATSWEKDSVFHTASKNIDIQTRELSRKLWVGLLKKLKSSEHEECVDLNDDVDSAVEDNGSLVPALLDKSKLPVVTSVLASAGYLPLDSKINYKIISKWGLNIYPDDEKLILFIRRKFSGLIRSSFCKLFSDMLELGAVLPSGKELQVCSWGIVSRELSDVAIKSVESIVEDQYTDLEIILSRFRIVDIDVSNNSSCTVRAITDDEKSMVMIRAKKFISKSLICSARMSWLFVVNNKSNSVGVHPRLKGKNIKLRSAAPISGIKLRYSDNYDISKSSNEFLSEASSIIRDKFSGMLKNKYKFSDGTTIGRFSWNKLYPKLIPIAKEEINNIFEDEIKKLEGIISESRVLVDYVNYCIVDRELTDEEKSYVFRDVIKRLNEDLRRLFSVSWRDITSYGSYHVDAAYFSKDVVDKPSASSIDEINFGEEYAENRDYNPKINLYYEDNCLILKIRDKFMREKVDAVRNKFIEMLTNKYTFDDNTVIDKLPWKQLSKKLLIVARDEVSAIEKKERVAINNILLRSRVIDFRDDGYANAVRDITSEERSSFLISIMKRISRISRCAFRKAWDSLISSQ
ncbi:MULTISPECIES: hypothetical protein [Candidatus Ichthyocystis]|uniref:Uncharacterized protein n=1 Tax=Candidatus Ichthyocystis hellenicum TaxID=1561003 RepID=A0A0S4M621_9BURK|nr:MULTISPECIES: hypothetical protein [Ichthyocystis]CUT17702.1 hypothetical protein Ark11_0879 [Candidatus Ichthyocystis hellenicum]